MDRRAITDRLDFAIQLIQHVRDNLEQKPQEIITARKHNKSKAIKGEIT